MKRHATQRNLATALVIILDAIERLEEKLETLTRKVEAMSDESPDRMQPVDHEVNSIRENVEKENTVERSVHALIDGIKALCQRALIAAVHAGSSQSHLQALQAALDTMENNKPGLVKAVAANTEPAHDWSSENAEETPHAAPVMAIAAVSIETDAPVAHEPEPPSAQPQEPHEEEHHEDAPEEHHE